MICDNKYITHKEPRKISNQNYSYLVVFIDQTLNLLYKLCIIHSNHYIHIHTYITSRRTIDILI